MKSEQRNIIVEKSFQFSVAVINFCDILENHKKYIVARQLIRSATSIGANVREAQHAESRLDFTHKMKLAIKEAEETAYWLDICSAVLSYPNPDGLSEKLSEIIKILSKIIYSSKSFPTDN